MPRYRQYETAAERQAAYRARKKQNVTNVTHNLVVWRQPAGYELLREVVKVTSYTYPDGRVMARLETRKFPPSSVATETHIHVCPSECRHATDEDIARLAMQEVTNRNVADVTIDLVHCRTAKPIKLVAWLQSVGFVETPYESTWGNEGTIQLQKGHMRLKIAHINDELGIVTLCEGHAALIRLLGL
jgi:hypothetical protein